MLTFGEKMTKHVGDNKKIITLMLASAAVLVMYLPELFDLLRPLFGDRGRRSFVFFRIYFKTRRLHSGIRRDRGFGKEIRGAFAVRQKSG